MVHGPMGVVMMVVCYLVPHSVGVIVPRSRGLGVLSWHLQCTAEGDSDARLTVSEVLSNY